MTRLFWCALPIVLGCASQQRPADTPPREADCDCPTATNDSALARAYDSSGRPLASAETEAAPAIAPPPADRYAVRTLGFAAAEPAAPRPRRVGRRDIRLRNARLDNALRALAEAGKFNLVVEGNLSEQVSLDLRAVEPYEALLALAEARGMDIRYRGNIVIVGGAKP